MKKTSETTSEQVLCGARRVDVQRTKNAILDATKESKEFDVVKRCDKKMAQATRKEAQRCNKITLDTAPTIHDPCRCLHMTRCGRVNYFKGVYRSPEQKGIKR